MRTQPSLSTQAWPPAAIGAARRLLRSALASTGLLAIALPASAAIVSTSSTVTPIAPSAGADFVEGGAFETGPGAHTVFAFVEAEAISVVGLPVDLQPIDLGSNWSPGDSSTPTTLTQDVSLYYLHFDTEDGTNVLRSGFVEFDAPVLGLIVETATLDSTDPVASASLAFDPARTLGATDSLRLEAANRRLVFDFLNGAGVDSVRVVTGDVATGSSFTEIVLAGGESFVEGGAFEGDGDGINTGYWFAEQSDVDLVALEVDLDTAALQSGWAVGQALQPTAITGRVDSYYVFFDSIDDSQNTLLSGTITLPRPVLGVVFSNARLVASDPALAVPGVSFATPRQLGTIGDALSLDPSGHTLQIDFSNASQTDDVRILIQAEPLAAPTLDARGIGLLCLSLGVLAVCALGGQRRPALRVHTRARRSS